MIEEEDRVFFGYGQEKKKDWLAGWTRKEKRKSEIQSEIQK
jgi:hypothetical protein